MHALLNLYRRLDLIQQKLSFRLAATVLVLAICGGGFGSLLAKSYSLNGQRVAIAQALQGQNYNDGDMHAVSLRQTGTVTINSRTYGDPELIDEYARTFDAEGEIHCTCDEALTVFHRIATVDTDGNITVSPAQTRYLAWERDSNNVLQPITITP